AYGGEPIADEEFASLVEAVSLIEPLIGDRPSHFEILTSAAFRWFADLAVDVAVVEVGLGGRWDATNVADGQVAVVTNVELDHEEYLGPTPRSAAEVKAGIIKPESFPVLDGAHKPAGAHAAAAAIDEAFGDTSGRVLVTGMLRGRDPDEMLAALGADRARLVIACPPPSPRALPAADVAAAASRIGVATE